MKVSVVFFWKNWTIKVLFIWETEIFFLSTVELFLSVVHPIYLSDVIMLPTIITVRLRNIIHHPLRSHTYSLKGRFWQKSEQNEVSFIKEDTLPTWHVVSENYHTKWMKCICIFWCTQNNKLKSLLQEDRTTWTKIRRITNSLKFFCWNFFPWLYWIFEVHFVVTRNALQGMRYKECAWTRRSYKFYMILQKFSMIWGMTTHQIYSILCLWMMLWYVLAWCKCFLDAN